MRAAKSLHGRHWTFAARPVPSLLMVVALGCSADLQVPLRLEPGGALLWARADAKGNVLDAQGVVASESISFALDEGELLRLAVLPPGSVLHPTGQPLNADELARLRLGVLGDCGRCLYPSAKLPTMAFSGQICDLAPSVVSQVYTLDQDELVALPGDSELAGLIPNRISFPGACACTPVERRLASELHVCSSGGFAGIRPTVARLTTDGTVHALGEGFGFAVTSTGPPVTYRFRPALGAISSATALDDGRLVLSARPRGPDFGNPDVRVLTSQGTIASMSGIPSYLARIGITRGSQGQIELGGLARRGTSLGPGGARCAVQGTTLDCQPQPVIGDARCPQTLLKHELQEMHVLPNGDAVATVADGLVFRAAGSNGWSCVPGSQLSAVSLPDGSIATALTRLSLGSVGRRLFVCAAASSNARNLMLLFSILLPEALATSPDGLVASFPPHFELVGLRERGECGGFASNADSALLLNARSREVWELDADGSMHVADWSDRIPFDMQRMSSLGDSFAVLGVEGSIYRGRVGTSQLEPVEVIPSSPSVGIATGDGFILYSADADPVEIRVGADCDDISVEPLAPVELGRPEAAIATADGALLFGHEAGQLSISHVTVDGIRTSNVPGPSSPVAEVGGLPPDSFLLRFHDGQVGLLDARDGRWTGVEGTWKSIDSILGIGWVGGRDRLARISRQDGGAVMEDLLMNLARGPFADEDSRRLERPEFDALRFDCPDSGTVGAWENLDTPVALNMIPYYSSWRTTGLESLQPDPEFVSSRTTIPASGERARSIQPKFIGFSGEPKQATVYGGQSELTTLPFPDPRHWVEGVRSTLIISERGQWAVVIPVP